MDSAPQDLILCLNLQKDSVIKLSKFIPWFIFLIVSTDSNASLLSIKDEDENDFILEQFESFSGLVQWMWLGLVNDTDGMLEVVYWLFAFWIYREITIILYYLQNIEV